MERGSWTKSLRVLALDVMDQLIARPASVLVSDPRNGNLNTFQGIRERLAKKKYAVFGEWREEVMKVIQAARAGENELIVDACDELEKYFEKRYRTLAELSEFRFQTALVRVVNELEDIQKQFNE